MPRFLTAVFVALAAASAFASDITVTHISRLPEIRYVWNSTNPTREGWPAEGQQILWRANVKSFYDKELTGVGYRWSEDGREIARGVVDLRPYAVTSVDLPRAWSFTRHRLAFDLDVVADEESASNNHLEVFTDALAAGFWVEQSLYDYFRANQGKLGTGATCWENWAQRQIDFFNEMAANAVYPETPHGVLDRWRIERIVVVPDGTLPLAPVDYVPHGNEYANAATHPDVTDRAVDLEWGFRALAIPTYGDVHSVSLTNPFYLAPVLLHELGHARYLVDVYGFDVQQAPGYAISITNDDGSLAFPQNFSFVYRTPELGLMNRSFSFIDRYSAAAMNLIAGARAVSGNYNEPENIGVFMQDLPAENAVTIRDPSGAAVANADVEIFRSEPGHADAWFATDYDNVPDLRLKSDANGRVFVGRCPFSADGTIVHTWRGSNAVAIVRARQNGKWLYGFLESRALNLEYWRGRTILGETEVVVGRDVCSATAPSPFAPAYDTTVATADVTLQWRGAPGASAYVVHAAVNGEAPQTLGRTSDLSMSVHLTGRVNWWVEAEFDGCPPARSESWRYNAPSPSWRRAAAHQ